jgi:hypothetical protein
MASATIQSPVRAEPSASPPAIQKPPEATNQRRSLRPRPGRPETADVSNFRNARRPILDRDVRTCEQQTVAAERLGDGHCHREACEHYREQQEAHGRRVRIDLARDPRRVVPGPPDDEEREERIASSGPAQVVEEQVRHLRDREDEDEVVEELERSCLLLLLSANAARVKAERPQNFGAGLRNPPSALSPTAFESATTRYPMARADEMPTGCMVVDHAVARMLAYVRIWLTSDREQRGRKVRDGGRRRLAFNRSRG